MQKFLIFLLFCTFFWGNSYAQNSLTPLNSTVAGNTSTAYFKEWTPFQTPAALTSERGISLIASAENRFLTKELFIENFAISAHTKPLDVALALSHFGFADYHEMLIGAAFARNFAGKFNLGIGVNYFTSFFQSLGKYKGVVFAQIGFQARVARNFYIGFHSYNPTFSKIKSSAIPEKLPAIFSLGILHEIKEKFNYSAQIDKDVYGAWRWALGTEYALHKAVLLRLGGYGTENFVPTLGICLNFKEFKFNLNCEYNLKLGLCTLGKLSYRFYY